MSAAWSDTPGVYWRMRGEAELRDLFEVEYAGLVRVSFFLCGDRDTAQEVVQEAFVRAAARWQRIRRYDRPGAWLRLVVVRQSVRARTRAARDGLRAEVPDAGREDHPVPDPELYAAISALSPDQRDCVVLHHLEDLPVTEVARLLGMKEGTVRSHLHRGRAELAARLATETDLVDGRDVVRGDGHG